MASLRIEKTLKLNFFLTKLELQDISNIYHSLSFETIQKQKPTMFIEGSGSQTGSKLPPGGILWGVMRNQNHNVVRYYERSLRNIEGT